MNSVIPAEAGMTEGERKWTSTPFASWPRWSRSPPSSPSSAGPGPAATATASTRRPASPSNRSDPAMSDFTSGFWSVYVAGATMVGIVACLLLLWITSRKKVAATADNTTGHVWDEDLTEMNNPMPRWWMWLFVLTIVFSLLYLVAYPGLGTYPGELNWSSRQEYAQEMEKADAELAPVYAQFTSRRPEEVAG